MQQQQPLLPVFLIALPAIAPDGATMQNPNYIFSSQIQQPHVPNESFHQVHKQTYNATESHSGNLDISKSNHMPLEELSTILEAKLLLRILSQDVLMTQFKQVPKLQTSQVLILR